jgi:hypothetical protein
MPTMPTSTLAMAMSTRRRDCDGSVTRRDGDAVFAKAITKARLDGQAFEDNLLCPLQSCLELYRQPRPGCTGIWTMIARGRQWQQRQIWWQQHCNAIISFANDNNNNDNNEKDIASNVVHDKATYNKQQSCQRQQQQLHCKGQQQ